MRALRLDLRVRIAIVLASVCIVVVGGFGITLYLASEEMQEALEEQLVADEMAALIRRGRLPNESVAGGGPNLRYYVLRSREDHELLPASFRALSPGHHQLGHGIEQAHVAVRDVDGARFIVAYNAGPHEAQQTRFQNLLFIVLAGVVAVALIVGYWLAGMLTRQLTQLAKRVATLGPDEPHPLLKREDQDREVAALANALDQYHSRILEMMKREQEFTANASHELRTPLTAIRTSCELLSDERGLSEKVQTRLCMIDHAAQQMTDRIEALLLLARRHQPAELETVALRRCVEEAAEPYRDEIARKGLAFDIAINENEVVQLDRKALQLVLANLIKNAARYTNSGHIRISYAAPCLTVSDSGSGIAAHHRPQLFERYYRADKNAEGLGLGLAIVHRICEDFGWKVEVQSKPGAGSAFSVVFN